MSAAERQAFQQARLDIAAAFGRARKAGLAPDSPEVQEITARHYEWVTGGRQGCRPDAQAFTGLGEMYVAGERFGANYDVHAAGTVELIRDARCASTPRTISNSGGVRAPAHEYARGCPCFTFFGNRPTGDRRRCAVQCPETVTKGEVP
ncbi:TipAS antibiotic-recognition domain-containing protein [Nocardia sp. NPDC004568]|uniref:TipAS antibiotic-recognition domain-containing protein n=1 Tax=Nocardia sp. NPDC004568 TaxID=3154551 RepID=UPI0033A95639